MRSKADTLVAMVMFSKPPGVRMMRTRQPASTTPAKPWGMPRRPEA
jgi:hypothetical protein